MQDENVIRLSIALVSSVVTFILGVIYNALVRNKQFKLTQRSFAGLNVLRLKGDFHKVYKGEDVRHIITRNYHEIRQYCNETPHLKPNFSLFSLSNIGPGVILECTVKVHSIAIPDVFEVPVYKWTTEVNIDFIKTDETIVICVDDLKAPVGISFVDGAEVTYKTQAGEKINVIMEYKEGELKFLYKFKNSLGLWRKWTSISLDKGLEWEKPNKE